MHGTLPHPTHSVPKGVPKGRPGGGGGKRRRRGSDYDDDEFMSASDSEGDGDMDDDSDGGGARRTKRARGSAGAYEEALGGPATQAVMDLNTHLTPVIRALIAWQADTRNGISPQLVNVLLHQVNRKAVKDYHKFVPVAKQMYLTRIQNKVRRVGVEGGGAVPQHRRYWLLLQTTPCSSAGLPCADTDDHYWRGL